MVLVIGGKAVLRRFTARHHLTRCAVPKRITMGIELLAEPTRRRIAPGDWPESAASVCQRRRSRATLRRMGAMDELADRLERATTTLTELGPATAAGEPWALTDVYGPGPESAWGPRELLAHLGEMLPYWMGEIELILDARVDAAGAHRGTEPPGFGRLEDDPIRVQVIGRDRAFPGRELLARIDAEGGRIARRFRALDDAQAGYLGRHVTRGNLSARDIAERLMVGHLEGHVTQLREILAGAR